MATVLVVDDRPVNREFLAMLLGYAGHQVTEAADGEQALKRVRERPPELIITDLMMPVMDGLEFTRRLRADATIAAIPVIFYTATYRVQEARDLALKCGADLVLPKPSEPQAILDAVDHLLQAPRPAAGTPHTDGTLRPLPEAPAVRQQRLQAVLQLARDAASPRAAAGETGASPQVLQNALSLRLAALLELALTLPAEEDPLRLAEQFCHAAQDIITARAVTVIVFGLDGRRAVLAAGTGPRETMAALKAAADGAAEPMAALLATGQTRIWPPPAPGVGEACGVGAAATASEQLMTTPIHLPSGQRGVLCLALAPAAPAFDETDRQLVATLAAQLALALGNRQLIEELKQHAGELQLEVQERKRVAAELSDSEARYRQLFDACPLPLWVYDLHTLAFLAVNLAAVEHYGYSRAEFLAMNILQIRPTEDAPRVLRAVAEDQRREADGQQHLDHTGLWRHQLRDGRLVFVEITSHRIDFAGRPAKLVLANDVTQRIEQQHRIARLSRIRAVLSGISSAMLRFDERDALLREAARVAATEGVFPLAWCSVYDPATQRFELVGAHGADPAVVEFIRRAAYATLPEGQRWERQQSGRAKPIVVHELTAEAALAPVLGLLEQRGFRSAAAFPLQVEDSVVAVLVLMASEVGFFDTEEIALLEWLSADLSFALDRLHKARQLDYLAFYDPLTGLPNARLFEDRMSQFLHAARQEQSKVCVVVLDLEHFTQINERLGRAGGDELLRQVAVRLGDHLVEPFTLGRIAADTFAAASPRSAGHHPGWLCDRLFEALNQPFVVNGRPVHIAAQAGVALYPNDGEDAITLFRNAETALQMARSAGERYAWHSSELNARRAQRQRLESDLRLAIESAQFLLHYHPRLDMANGELVGAEALIRWQHPQRGLLSPAAFITLAEETGLIVPVGNWALQAVCEQQAAWCAARHKVVPIAVNLSPVQIEQSDVLKVVRSALEAQRLEPRLLELELTESAVMQDPALAAQTLKALRKLGVGLALDDFGTGYSSLAHLKRFPFSAVKIDRSFVTELTSNADDAAIATAIIAMAHRLKLKVVAEGVESLGQFNFLRAQGCDELQGHLFSAPVDAAAFGAMLRNGARLELPRESSAGEQTILLVDDEPGIRSSLIRLLRRDGYRILTAPGGAEALELLALHPVQVIISDQRMPGMSGTDLLSTVSALYPDTVRIILSGYTDLMVVTDAVNRGSVFKFLTKPWDDDQLREQVRDAFRRYRPRG